MAMKIPIMVFRVMTPYRMVGGYKCCRILEEYLDLMGQEVGEGKGMFHNEELHNLYSFTKS
jgi:hypothetical protein